jgi:hypothetical protein
MEGNAFVFKQYYAGFCTRGIGLIFFLGLQRGWLIGGLWFPSVQAVSDAMAICALGEAGQHTGRMRRAVTALTGRRHLVLVLMTGDTTYISVFRIC